MERTETVQYKGARVLVKIVNREEPSSIYLFVERTWRIITTSEIQSFIDELQEALAVLAKECKQDGDTNTSR